MNTHIGDQIFQNTPRRVTKFRENWHRDVEKSVVGKKIKLTSFFPIVDTCLSSEDIARQSCAMVQKWRFSSEPRAAHFRPAF